MVFWYFHVPSNYGIIPMQTKFWQAESQEIGNILVLLSNSSVIYYGLVQESWPVCKNMKPLTFNYCLHNPFSSSCLRCCLQQFLIAILVVGFNFHCCPSQTINKDKADFLFVWSFLKWFFKTWNRLYKHGIVRKDRHTFCEILQITLA